MARKNLPRNGRNLSESWPGLEDCADVSTVQRGSRKAEQQWVVKSFEPKQKYESKERIGLEILTNKLLTASGGFDGLFVPLTHATHKSSSSKLVKVIPS